MNNSKAQTMSAENYIKEVQAAIQCMEHLNFGSTLKNLMKWRGVSKNTLSDLLGSSPKTIQRMRSSEQCSASKQTIIAICVILQLPAPASRCFLQIAGYQMGYTSEDIMYDLILNHHYQDGISACNTFLTSQGFMPLTNS